MDSPVYPMSCQKTLPMISINSVSLKYFPTLQLFIGYKFLFFCFSVSVSETLYPSSLHHLIWIGVQYLNINNKNSICDVILPLKFTLKFTGSLQFSPNSSSSYAENLSKIDIEAFLFACGGYFCFLFDF